MAKYRFKAYTADGRIEAGELEAGSARDVQRILSSKGMLTFETEEASFESMRLPFWSRLTSRRLSVTDYGEFARQTATLLEAGLPVDKALRFLAEKSGGEKIRSLADNLHDKVASGSTLSDAFYQFAPSAPPYFSSLLKAGEAKGSLSTTLAELASFIEARAEIREKLRSALTYPLVLAATAVATISILVVVLAPALAPLFDNAGTEPPTVIWVMKQVSTAWSNYWLIMGIIFFAAGSLAAIGVRNLTVRQNLDRLRLRLPYFGALHQNLMTAMFAHTLGTLLRAGVPLVAALKVSSGVVTNASMSEAIRTASDRVAEGTRISKTLQDTKNFPDLALRLISVGEESGQLDTILLKLARLLDQDCERKTERGLALLGPLLTVVIGLGIGTMLLSVMKAILSVNDIVVR